MNTHILGTKGEVKAKDYLISLGYKILETNYSNIIGEIDIIAQDQKTIVFVEVKTRETLKFGYPREAVTLHKQNKIHKVAMAYLKFKRKLNSPFRFDCIEILSDEITHLKNCF